MFPRLTCLSATLLAAIACHGAAHAAESYDNCTGFIDALPAVVTTQGAWCLRQNLSTDITSGAAITIAANNVTIDCNDFKLGGLAAGNGSFAYGVHSNDRVNATVRHCNVRGFATGIVLSGGAGHLVEDNRLDNNLYAGISVSGDNGRVRRNAVYDTGQGQTAYGIKAGADIVDNTVSGLFATKPNGKLVGIHAFGPGAQVRGNQVTGFDMTASDGGAVESAYGIELFKSHQRASGNQVSADGPVNGVGIYALYNSSYCMDNSVGGFTLNIDSGCIGSGNLTAP